MSPAPGTDRAARQGWVRHLLAEETLRALVEDVGPCVSVMPLKGVWTARVLYRDPAERPLADVDVLVHGADRETLLRALEIRGWQVVPEARAFADKVVVRRADVPGLDVDVHLQPLPSGLGRVDTAWMFADATRDTTTFGAPVWLPSRERLVAHLIGNLAKDHGHRAAPHAWEDLRRALRDAPETFAPTIRSAGLEDCVPVLAALAPADHPLLALAAALPPSRRARWIARGLGAGQGSAPPSPAQRALALLSFRGPRGVLAALRDRA